MRTARCGRSPGCGDDPRCRSAVQRRGPKTWTRTGRQVWLGDPTETALLQAAADAGLDVQALRTRIPRIDEQPFDSTRKRMSTIHDALGGGIEELAAAPTGRVALVRQGRHRRPAPTHRFGVGQRCGGAVRRRLARPHLCRQRCARRRRDAGPRASPSGRSPTADDDPEADLVLLGLCSASSTRLAPRSATPSPSAARQGFAP